LLSDGHKADLSRAKSLQQDDLLGGVSAEPVHADHHHGVSIWTAGFEQVGNLVTSGALSQELRTTDALLPDDFDKFGIRRE
jgi:hypothetical protein